MNKHEQIEGHLTAIGYFSSPSGCWSFSKKVSRVQEELDAIKALLQPEPESESLAASVLRLTELCNTLEKKNYELSLELTQYRDGWFPCATVEELAKLRAEIERLEAERDATTRSNAYLRGCNNRLEQDLRAHEEEIVKQARYTGARKEQIKILHQDLDATLKTNASLRQLLQRKKDALENSESALRHVRDQLETILEQTEP